MATSLDFEHLLFKTATQKDVQTVQVTYYIPLPIVPTLDKLLSQIQILTLYTFDFTFELGIGNTVPFTTAIANASTPHHVALIMHFVPLITNTIHNTIIGCANFFMS